MVSVYFQKDLTGKLRFLDEKYLVNKSLPTWNRDNLIKILSIILSHFGQGVADEKHKGIIRWFVAVSFGFVFLHSIPKSQQSILDYSERICHQRQFS